MKNNPIISIVMPTYNSENVLDISLSSIRMQNIDQDKIEILVVDGGSTDKTLDIARKYDTIILNNPLRLPEPAGLIGLQHATGKYLIRMGSDEELLRNDQLSQRISFFEKFPEVQCLLVNRILPVRSCGIASNYMNSCDDPFSFVIYKKKKTILATFKKNIAACTREGCKLAFSGDDIRPIGDGGTMLSLDFIRSTWNKDTWDVPFWSGMFDNVVSATGYCGCIENDEIKHYSNAKLNVFLSKQKFRVINNLFEKQSSGFSSRSVKNETLQKRKKWFYLYALTIIGPLCDSIRLAITHKDASMLLHVFYIYYICFYAAYCLLNKLFGRTIKNKVYGK